MRFPALIRTALLAALLADASACAYNGGKKKEVTLPERPVEELYNSAADLLDKHRYADAVTAFDEVERQHPYSSWASRATLMNAYANYQNNRYDAAVEAARRYLSLHPGNDDAPYAYYLIAVCYFEQILDVGRDQKNTADALNALNEVVQRFPASEYARDARIKAEMAYDQLAGKEMEVGRYYESRDQHVAAIARFKNVIDNPHYQTTTHTPEALHRLVECYLSVGMGEEAQRAAAVLGYNFPGSVWYQRSYALMTGKGVPIPDQEEARKRGWLSRLLPFGGKPSEKDARKPAPPPPSGT